MFKCVYEGLKHVQNTVERLKELRVSETDKERLERIDVDIDFLEYIIEESLDDTCDGFSYNSYLTLIEVFGCDDEEADITELTHPLLNNIRV